MGLSDTGKFAMVKGCSGQNCRESGQCGEQSSLRGLSEGRPFDQDGRVLPEIVGKIRIGLELVQRPRRGKLAAARGQLLRIECEDLGRILQGLVDVVAALDAAGQVRKPKAHGVRVCVLDDGNVLSHTGSHARCTKLSTTFFSPALSKAMVSLLPSILVTRP